MDFRIPAPVESQYHTDQFVSAYDSIADFPDRPDNLFALANSIAGLATGSHRDCVHQPEQRAAAEHQNDGQLEGRDDDDVPGSRAAPSHWCWRFNTSGYDEDTLNQLDAILMPRVNAGYSRNDDPATAPVQVDPVHGFDPLQSPRRPTRRRSVAVQRPDLALIATGSCPC